MNKQSPPAKKSARINSGLDTRVRYADDLALQGQKARSVAKTAARDNLIGDNDGHTDSASDITTAIAMANNEHRQRPIVVLDKRFLELTETPLLHHGKIIAYTTDNAENATMKMIAHATEEEQEDESTTESYVRWSKSQLCEYIAEEWKANRLPAKKALQQYFIKEHGKILMTKQQIHGLKSSIYKELLETSKFSYSPGSNQELPILTQTRTPSRQ